MPTKSPTALLLAFDGIEEVEALAPVDMMRRAGIEVTIASVDEASQVTGRNGISFSVDTALSQVDANDYDMLVLPGGPGVLKLENNNALNEMLRARDAVGKDIAAICAAPRILAANGILNRLKATSHSSVRDELPIAVDEPVVIDGHVITSQGAGTAIAFGLALVSRLLDEETANAIALSIHA